LCVRSDNRGVRVGDGSKSRSDVRGFPDDASCIDYVADDHEASGDPDTRLQWRAVSQRGDRRN
jgi:hypothetical protein